MQLALLSGVVLATHADDAVLPAGAYGAAEILLVPDGFPALAGSALGGLSLIDAKALAVARITARRNGLIAAGYQHNFGASAGVRTLDCRTTEDQANWLALHGLWSALDPETMVEVIDAGNAVFATSAETGAGAILALGQWKSAIVVAARNLKNAVLQAADAGALAAIDLDDGWPGE
ncbi:DUF4376 domain-containing protein [Jiella marina]|uniref:DUF4376 domain-containing protein n=1 Tax=Jiella sp. LLJ827 TaxID=2917712 RepID=UPI00210179EA|nr:hypothetical protein [Jiella sp. LLJ827]MCQ0986389.1 hypothetical protein [Jiella sp. LLJ827]